jgi:hypothetical protein
MEKALNTPTERPGPGLHLVEAGDERLDDTIVQERDKISRVMTTEKRNPDAKQLQEAFSDIEYEASNIPGGYQISGHELPLDSDHVYRLSIVKPHARDSEFGRGDSITSVHIGFDSDGNPHWEIDGDKLDDNFEMALVYLLEDTIAEARHL